jgi:uncharacterized DUF497 family protein
MKNEFEHLSGFQWDQRNIDKNLIKHKVENWKCEQIFFNRPLLVLDDSQHSIPEKRWAAFGKTDTDRFLIVIFTKRGDLIRVISARDMNKKERKFYDEK